MQSLPTRDQLPKQLQKLLIFDYVKSKEPVIKEYFCRGRHKNCKMINPNQVLILLDRQNVRENGNLFILFQQRGKALTSIHQVFLMILNLILKILLDCVMKYGKSLETTLSLICLKIEILKKTKELIGTGGFCSL